MISILKQDNIYQTERLTIRQLTSYDFDAFHEMQGDPEVMKYVAKKANTEKENRKDLKKVISRYLDEENEFWVWAVVKKESEDFVGTIALIKDKEDNWEIGYRLLRKYWGKGFGSEMVAGLIRLCEEIPEINNLVAYADRRNIASQCVLNKNGFVNLGIKYNDEEDCEDYIYSVSTT
ncbi:GNAT family N-acetyltransferase [Portibacter marinus]|uniref:GNAT family N-acetyltransferase n=1 Tax=Portibacter marinus TaxID=2898660 RepID=UPI001F3128F0|nr:GNAT family N-acetyltransferase [Portibacter marinus]